MIIATTDGLVEVWADTNSSLDNVIVASKTIEVLDGIVTSLELAGVSEDTPGLDKVGPVTYIPAKGYYAIRLDRTTFNIWHAFEVNSYLKYGANEFEIAIADPVYRETIHEIRSKIYE